MNEPFVPVEMKGPNGGNLEATAGKPEWRREGFHAEPTVNGERGLHRFVKDYDAANPARKNEQPWHRMAAYMLNAGRTNSEIAMAAGVHPTVVSHLRGQRWFQELCATIANENGEEILGAIKSHVLDAVEEIASLMRNAESESVRHNAAKTLIEQGVGKPLQKIISSVGHSNLDAREEYEVILNELKVLQLGHS